MRKTKKAAVVGGTVVALFGAGIAYAAWTSTGTGDGAVTAGTNAALVVTDGQSDSTLFPTVQGAVVKFTVKNNNPYKVQLSDLKINSFTVDDAHSGCTVANSGVSADDTTPTDVINANGGTVTVSAPVHMTADSNGACQGATFTFSATATGASTS